MKTIDKIDYILASLSGKENAFLKRVNITKKQLESWRNYESEPTAKDVESLCRVLKLSPIHFLDEKISVCRTSELDSTHIIVGDNKHSLPIDSTDYVPEDFQRQDDSRYEERD